MGNNIHLTRKRTYFTGLVLALLLFSLLLPIQEAGGQSASAKWNLVVYFAADNNLGERGFGLEDIEDMKTIGSSPDVNVIVLYDGEGTTDSHVYYVESGDVQEIPLNWINPSWNSTFAGIINLVL